MVRGWTYPCAQLIWARETCTRGRVSYAPCVVVSVDIFGLIVFQATGLWVWPASVFVALVLGALVYIAVSLLQISWMLGKAAITLLSRRLSRRGSAS